jgi:hypothetical protein
MVFDRSGTFCPYFTAWVKTCDLNLPYNDNGEFFVHGCCSRCSHLKSLLAYNKTLPKIEKNYANNLFSCFNA